MPVAPDRRSESAREQESAALGRFLRIVGGARCPAKKMWVKIRTLKGLHRGPAWSILAAMPQSLARILVHTVFSTKDRRPSLRDTALRKELHHYLGVILKC